MTDAERLEKIEQLLVQTERDPSPSANRGFEKALSTCCRQAMPGLLAEARRLRKDNAVLAAWSDPWIPWNATVSKCASCAAARVVDARNAPGDLHKQHCEWLAAYKRATESK